MKRLSSQSFLYNHHVIFMFIDSPNFVKRKVVNSDQRITNDPSGSIPLQYQFGQERSLLAKHVRDRLNSHEQDNLILQKFRKQAQILKHQKWLSKKSQSKLPPPLTKPASEKLEIQKQEQYPRLSPITSVIIPQRTQSTQQIPYQPQPKHSKIGVIQHYQKLLKSKDRQLQKKDNKLKKSKIIIDDMKHRLKDLQRDRKWAQQMQVLEMQRISSLIQQMNFKIASNRAVFQEELAKIKIEKISPNKSQHKTPSTSVKNIYAKLSSVNMSPLNSQKLISPKVFYDLPQTSSKLFDENPEYYAYQKK